MNQTPSFSLRQTLEAMPLVFNPMAAPGLKANIQFNVSGAEPGVYTLQITNDECVFQAGASPEPTLSINTPSEIWLGILHGQLSGQEALMKGQYTVQGDLSLLLKWGAMFQSGEKYDFRGTGQPAPGWTASVEWNGLDDGGFCPLDRPLDHLRIVWPFTPGQHWPALAAFCAHCSLSLTLQPA